MRYYTEKTKKILWAKSGGKCAFPACERDLIGEDDNIQGEICHIVARNKGGARWRADYGDDIDDEKNLILLCADHHKMIDDFPEKYTEEMVRKYKKDHEAEVKARMSLGEPWKVNFSQIYYMNIRRIEMQAAIDGVDFEGNIEKEKCLHSLGWDLNYLMLKVSGVMNRLSFCAVPLNTNPKKLRVGQFVEIKDKFRTKNVPTVDKVMQKQYYPKGDLQEDAQLYNDREGIRRYLTIDPNWLATTTAFVSFRARWIEVAGIGLITGIDEEQKRIVVTPYVLGVPKTPYDEMYARFARY